MTLFNLLSLVGGLSLFLFGISIMGDGLEKKAGGRLSGVLQKLTASRMRGFLLGLAVTSVIQSSSATTVMVVGFVNSGIMTLSQAIGIIMGANVGTTVTAWMLSLTGIQGDSLLMQLLKPSSFSPVFAFIGIILYMFTKSSRKKDVGTILIGFAVLMYGMETMSAAVKPLADVPAFANILLLFSNPILGVLTGMLITAIIQSSSASVGILQALSATGKITYASAVPIVLGQNIGTCVTALLSSIGTNKNARRAALVHLYFNVIGTTVFLCLFYGLDAIFHFSFIANRASAVGIAVIHTVFNLSATALLLPFCNGLEKLAYLTIRDDPADTRETFPLLDERLLVTPTVAISQCKALTNEMANLSKDALLRSIELIENFSEEKAVVIMNMEDVIDRFEDQLGSYLVKISSKSLSAADGREVSKLLHSISDLERIGDHAVNIEKTAREIHEKKVAFSEQAKEEIVTISGAVREILELATESFIKEDVAVAKMVEPLEQVVDLLRSKLKRRHIHRLQEGSCTIEMGFIFLDLLTNFERVADHCSNIAVCIIEMEHGTLDTHEYLKEVKRISDDEYSALFENFKQKYAVS